MELTAAEQDLFGAYVGQFDGLAGDRRDARLTAYPESLSVW